MIAHGIIKGVSSRVAQTARDLAGGVALLRRTELLRHALLSRRLREPNCHPGGPSPRRACLGLIAFTQ
jgi:hypothetical protein